MDVCVLEMKTSQNSSTEEYKLSFLQGFHNIVPMIFSTGSMALFLFGESAAEPRESSQGLFPI